MALRKPGAYSLAEVIVALGVFSMVALGLLSLFVSARAASQAGTGSVAATSVLEGEVDSQRTLPYPTLLGYLTTPPPSYVVSSGGQPYTVQVSATRVSTSSVAPEYNLIDLAVTVSWQEKQSLDQAALAHEMTRTMVAHTTAAPTNNY